MTADPTDKSAGERLAAIRVALALQPNDGTRSVAVLWPHDAEFLLSQLDARDARIAAIAAAAHSACVIAEMALCNNDVTRKERRAWVAEIAAIKARAIKAINRAAPAAAETKEGKPT